MKNVRINNFSLLIYNNFFLFIYNSAEIFNKLFGKGSVIETREGKRRVFQYKCPHSGVFIIDQLQRHLIKKHNCEGKDAKLLQTKMRVILSTLIVLRL